MWLSLFKLQWSSFGEKKFKEKLNFVYDYDLFQIWFRNCNDKFINACIHWTSCEIEGIIKCFFFFLITNKFIMHLPTHLQKLTCNEYIIEMITNNNTPTKQSFFMRFSSTNFVPKKWTSTFVPHSSCISHKEISSEYSLAGDMNKDGHDEIELLEFSSEEVFIAPFLLFEEQVLLFFFCFAAPLHGTVHGGTTVHGDTGNQSLWPQITAHCWAQQGWETLPKCFSNTANVPSHQILLFLFKQKTVRRLYIWIDNSGKWERSNKKYDDP